MYYKIDQHSSSSWTFAHHGIKHNDKTVKASIHICDGIIPVQPSTTWANFVALPVFSFPHRFPI